MKLKLFLIALVSILRCTAQPAYAPTREVARSPQVISSIQSMQALRTDFGLNPDVIVVSDDALAGPFHWNSTSVAETNLNCFESSYPDSDSTGRWLRVVQPVRRSIKFIRSSLISSGIHLTYQSTNGVNVEWDRIAVPEFSGTQAASSNWAVFVAMTPSDMVGSPAMFATLMDRMTGSDTGARTYRVGVASLSSWDEGAHETASNWATLSIPANPSGARKKVGSVADVALPGWPAVITAGQVLYIELQRSGDTDGSSLDSDLFELEITYIASR